MIRGRPMSVGADAPLRLIERNAVSAKGSWWVVASGVVEPLLYLLGLGLGLGQLVGQVDVGGRSVDYAMFIAPGLMASSAMNGAIFDTTYNFFFKLKQTRLFEGLLNTPLTLRDIVLGELGWAVLRGGVYAVFFILVMLILGLVGSWWAVLTVPAALLIAWAFAASGTALTTYVRAWTDFDMFTLVLQPLFLASTTFFPLSVYPGWAQPIVVLTPLYNGVALIRDLTLGTVGWADLGHVAYLVGLGVFMTAFTTRRLRTALLS